MENTCQVADWLFNADVWAPSALLSVVLYMMPFGTLFPLSALVRFVLWCCELSEPSGWRWSISRFIEERFRAPESSKSQGPCIGTSLNSIHRGVHDAEICSDNITYHHLGCTVPVFMKRIITKNGENIPTISKGAGCFPWTVLASRGRFAHGRWSL